MNKFSIRILDGASLDIQEAIDWYESQRKDLGFEFYQKFLGVTHVLSENPYQYQEYYLFVRRAFMGRFPYTVFYAVDEINSLVEIIALIHQKASPDEIRHRINVE